MQDAGDKAAHGSDTDMILHLQNSCWPSNPAIKKQTQLQHIKINSKIHLTRFSVCTLLFCCRAVAIAFAPSSPTLLQPCKTHVGPQARRSKSKSQLHHTKINSKIHLTRLSVCTLLFCCRAVAIAFAPSTPTWLQNCKTHVGGQALKHGDQKAKANFSTQKSTPKFILQGPASARCCSVAERRKSPSLPRRRLGSCSAKLTLALKHGDQKANPN
jgi:hypothetical protein